MKSRPSYAFIVAHVHCARASGNDASRAELRRRAQREWEQEGMSPALANPDDRAAEYVERNP